MSGGKGTGRSSRRWIVRGATPSHLGKTLVRQSMTSTQSRSHILFLRAAFVAATAKLERTPQDMMRQLAKKKAEEAEEKAKSSAGSSAGGLAASKGEGGA